jgi:tyrosine-protein kinase Etk/Wzc
MQSFLIMGKTVDEKAYGASERTLFEVILYYLRIFLKAKWFILLTVVIVTLAAVAYCIASISLPPDKSPLPNIYTAQAKLLVQENRQDDIASSFLGAMGVAQSSAVSSYRNSDLIREVLQSRGLLDTLATEFNMVERYNIVKSTKTVVRSIIVQNTSLTYASNSGVFRISYQDTDPVLAKDMVNRMIELLDEWFSLNRGLAKQKQRQILADKISEVKTEISSLQYKLKSLQKQYGVLNVEELGQSQAASMANLRSQLILKEVEIKNYESFSKINDPRLEQLKEERQNLLDLIQQNQTKLLESDSSANTNESASKNMSLPDVAQLFSQLTLELDIQQRIYNTLSPQYEAAKLTPESEPVFSVLEKAEVPDMKSGPKRSRIVMMAFGGSFAGSLAIVLAWNFFKAQIAILRKKNHQGAGMNTI